MAQRRVLALRGDRGDRGGKVADHAIGVVVLEERARIARGQGQDADVRERA